MRKSLVGGARVRDISGGEKKRVSISEALACQSLINCWDKYAALSELPNHCVPDILCSSTRGLDPSTALEFVQALRIGTDIARTTTAVTIYQASENVYGVFDKVCVVYEGRMSNRLLQPNFTRSSNTSSTWGTNPPTDKPP